MRKPVNTACLALFVVFLLPSVSLAQAQTVLIEAEGFENLGGWVVDQQFADQMGSPFLLAHGLGEPVEDAVAKVELPKAGSYRVFVRTRDWVAPWKAPGAPGKFQLLIDGKSPATTFGTEGTEWHWQDGGTVDIANKQAIIALRDLTGFDGRCDAIVLTSDLDFVPPNDEKLPAFRRKLLGLDDEPEDAGQFDLVVVGGGMAGTCSAISAARLGCKVALIQDRPVLGGNNSSDVRVHLNGQINLPPYPAIGDVVKELDPGFQGNARPAPYYDDEKKLRVVKAEKNLHLFLNMHAFKAEKQGGRITAVIARHIRSSKEFRFRGSLFADCTGDGTLGFLAGADFRMGREGRAETGESLAPEEPDKMTMGSSVQWYSSRADRTTGFPDCPWAMQFDEKTCHYLTRGDWNWETGLNRNQITEFEFIRDYALRAAFGNWSYLKNKSSKTFDYADRKLDWVAYVAGKRESRRLLGDVILREQDILGRKQFPDAMVTTTWTIDLHYPDPENTKYFPGEEFRTIAEFTPIKPYPVPYRCFYSRNIENLFMAGRDISVTHVALGTVRVMRTCGMMGEVVGMAASLCTQHDTTPRGVYDNHLDELKQLAEKGVGREIVRNDPAFKQALENLNDHYRNYKWEDSSSDGYADPIESALNLYNREPVASAADWIDSETKVMWAMQKQDGVIEGWHGDGNFARTTIMYCLWKTKGLTIRPWREDVVFGAVQDPDVLKITLRAEKDWTGKLIFDAPRHQTIMRMPIDWPRINQFPEWFTAHAEKRCDLLDLTANTKKTIMGKDLAAGIDITLKAGSEKHILVK